MNSVMDFIMSLFSQPVLAVAGADKSQSLTEQRNAGFWLVVLGFVAIIAAFYAACAAVGADFTGEFYAWGVGFKVQCG